MLVAIGHLIIRSARNRSVRAQGASRDARPAEKTGYRPRRNEYANADQGPRRRERILAHAAKSRPPAVYSWREAASDPRAGLPKLREQPLRCLYHPRLGWVEHQHALRLRRR